MRRTAMLAAVLALAAAGAPGGAGSADAGLPVIRTGSSVGEGVPLKAYATVSPTVHLFGDDVTASVAVVADTRWVNTADLRVSTGFRPYVAVRRPIVRNLRIGRFAQVTWTWTLRCLTSPCLPGEPPSEQSHVFHFAPIHIDYLAPGGTTRYGVVATWPKVEVLSQISPGVVAFLQKTKQLNWRVHVTPVAAPTYRASAALLFWLVLGAGLAVLLSAAALAARWYTVVRPRAAAVPGAVPSSSTLERALAVLEWAHARGDETLQRKALERVAGEIVVETPLPEADDLSRTARELAWSSRTPEDSEVEIFSDRARETGRQQDQGEPKE